MRKTLWTYWRRGGAAAILAMPSGPLNPTPTRELQPAPRLSSTKPCWSPSICATWPKRWDLCDFKTKMQQRNFTPRLNQHGVGLSPASLFRSPWRRGQRCRRWRRRPVGFWRKCLKTCSWGLSGSWATHSPRCSRDSSPASSSTWRVSTRSVLTSGLWP